MLVSPFSTADEFLKSLQNRLARPTIPGGAQAPEFEDTTRAQLREAGYNPDEMVGPTAGFAVAVGHLRDTVVGAVPVAVRDQIVTRVAIGVLDAGSVNARILRSHEGFYAVVVHSGLMLLLHKCFKYIVGWQKPEEVIYCNRKPPSELSGTDFREYMLDVVENCRRFGAPYGAMIRLTAYAAALQSVQLSIAELFVVCLELGHFINGDLETESDFRTFDGHDWVSEYVENQNRC